MDADFARRALRAARLDAQLFEEVAVRQVLDYKSTWRALGVSAIGWAVQAVLLATTFWLLGGPGRPA